MTIDSIMLIKSAIHKHIMQKKNCIVILLLMALFVYLEYPIKEYAIVHGSVSAWVVATFSADSKYQMFIFFGLILWVSDFQVSLLELHDYRDGVLVQTISIALLTLFYSLICIVLSIIPIIGYISFDADWNPVILKLAKNGYGAIHGIISINSNVVSLFPPAKVMLVAFALQWLIGTFIGLLILIGDSCFYNGAGVIAANVTLFWSYQVTDFAWPYFVYFSPVSWSTLSTYVPTCIQQIPTVWQGIALSILLNAILILLVLLVNERKNTGRILPNSLKEKLQ